MGACSPRGVTAGERRASAVMREFHERGCQVGGRESWAIGEARQAHILLSVCRNTPTTVVEKDTHESDTRRKTHIKAIHVKTHATYKHTQRHPHRKHQQADALHKD